MLRNVIRRKINVCCFMCWGVASYVRLMSVEFVRQFKREWNI